MGEPDEKGAAYLITGSPRAFREACELGVTWSKHLMKPLKEELPLLFDDMDISDLKDETNPRITAEIVDIEDYKNDEAIYQHHKHMCVKFIVNRAVSHELVRHRQHILQESQRYCKYMDEVTFIKPMFFEEGSFAYEDWHLIMEESEAAYLRIIAMKNEDGSNKYTAQAARTVLPNSCKTELLLDMNLARWRHFFTLRTSSGAEPSMREVTIPLLEDVRKIYPNHFNDLHVSLVGE